MVGAAAAAVLTMALGCSSYDMNDRRLATQLEYAISDQTCGVEGDRVVATGVLTNHSGRDTGFGVIVRFLDGDVDLGSPPEVDHPEPLTDGDTWAWEVGLDIDERPADLRCNVIQVVLGDDVNG